MTNKKGSLICEIRLKNVEAALADDSRLCFAGIMPDSEVLISFLVRWAWIGWSKNRTSSIKVTGCQARVKIDMDVKTGEFKVVVFEAIHNHALLECLDIYTAIYTTISDNTLTYLDKDIIMKVSTLNIGATKAFNLNACLKGGYHRIRTSKIAFKNFWRNFVSMIGQNDAGCVVDQLSIRKKTYPKFFFKYNLKGAVLHSLFWADEVAQENYSMFSDVISMDATCHTNRYNIIFVPFTAINNQSKSINFCCLVVL